MAETNYPGAHGDEEFEIFFDEEARAQEIDAQITATAERIATFLMERGVELPPAGSEVNDDTMDLPATAASIDKRVAVILLASMVASAAAEGESQSITEQTEIKKDLQAFMLTRGLGDEWLDAVDRELPGEPLDQLKDMDLVAEKITQTEEFIAVVQARMQKITERFIDLLASSGDNTLTQDETYALHELIGVYNIRVSSPNLAQRLAWAEEARAVLMSRGITITPRWQRIIELGEWDEQDDEV